MAKTKKSSDGAEYLAKLVKEAKSFNRLPVVSDVVVFVNGECFFGKDKTFTNIPMVVSRVEDKRRNVEESGLFKIEALRLNHDGSCSDIIIEFPVAVSLSKELPGTPSFMFIVGCLFVGKMRRVFIDLTEPKFDLES
ncbi:MAG: hypothetical protein US81_C0031G0005 [Parcubacteria group bacterium GW2011_GWE2_38_18]|nr:MAG: hypothetical protein US81_C0031G0005 [Parcubacteria group bacterium GW2011_GWE2_38_18]